MRTRRHVAALLTALAWWLCTSLAAAQTLTVSTNAAHSISDFLTVSITNQLNNSQKPLWTDTTTESWSNSFNDSWLRYPGGGPANVWDWVTGEYWNNVPGTDQPNPERLEVPDSLGGLQVLDSSVSFAPVTFELNVVTTGSAVAVSSDDASMIADQINLLSSAAALGIPMNGITLGSEIYDDSMTGQDFKTVRFDSGTQYADEMNEWISSITAVFPAVKIAVSLSGDKGDTDRLTDWDGEVLSAIQGAQAADIHDYDGFAAGSNTDTILADAYVKWSTVEAYGVEPAATDGLESWISEFELNDNSSSNVYAGAWVHGLFDGIMLMQELWEPHVTRAGFFNMATDSPGHSAVYQSAGGQFKNGIGYAGDGQGGPVTPTVNSSSGSGLAAIIFGRALKGATSVEKLTLNNVPEIQATGPPSSDKGVAYPIAIGAMVNGPSGYQAMLINDSTQTVTVNLSAIGTNATVETMSTWISSYVYTPTSVSDSTSAMSGATFSMPPYSINRAYSFFNMNAPSSPGATSVYTTSATYSWGANGNSGATYLAEISSNNFTSVAASSQTANLSATFTGLNSNTTYYFQVQVYTPTTSNFTAAAATSTLAAAPLSGNPSAVGNASLTETWGANGNPSGTLYVAQISSDSFATVFASSLTYSVSAAFTGLSADTTYYGQAAAYSNNGSTTVFTALGSTITLVNPPSYAASTFTAVGISSVTVSWADGGNGAGTIYDAQISTDNFNSVNYTSATANLYATFGAGPDPALNPNVTYYFQVQAVGDNNSGYIPLGSTTTLAAAPIGLGFEQVYVSSITLSWNSDGNPAGTSYQVSYWQATGSTQTLTVSATTGTITSLFSGTTYYAAVAAFNNGDIPTAGNQVVSTMTDYAQPVSPAVVSVSSISASFSWGTNGNPNGTSYLAEISSDNFADIAASSQTANSTATFSGLGSNTTYYFQVQAANYGASFIIAPATSTTVVPPLSAAPSSIGASSITFNWSANGDSPSTAYILNFSTDSNFADKAYVSTTVYNAFALMTGLFGNATYYSRVRSIGNDGSDSSQVNLPSTTTFTAASTPDVNTYFNIGLSSIAVQWDSVDSTQTIYSVQMSTDNFNTVNVSSNTRNLSLIFGTGGAGPALDINTSYYFQVQADGSRNNSGYVSLGSTATSVVAPTSLSITDLYQSSVTLSWVATGDPAGTTFQVNYWRMTGSTQSVTVNTTTAALTSLFTGATYYASVIALNVDGAAAPDSQVVSTVIAAGLPLPGNPSVTAVYVTSATYNWTLNGAPGGTSYLADVSTDDFNSISQSSQTANTFATFTGLNSNTTYYFEVQAANPLSDFSFAPATSTLIASPISAAPSAVTANSITENWGADSNPPTTLYLAQISTNSSFSSIAASSLTYNVSAAFSGLTGDATYYAEVLAYGNGGSATPDVVLPSTMTLPDEPQHILLGNTYTSVGISSVTVAWRNGGNGPGAVYDAQISTDNFNSVNYTSATSNLNAYFGTGGAGPALNPYTTYYFQVQAVGGGNSSAFFSLGSTVTLNYALPANPVATAMYLTSATYSWGLNSDPAGTLYLAEISSDNFADVLASSQTNNSSATFTGLSFNTTYYLQVEVSTQNTSFAMAPATSTLASAPAGPGLEQVYLSSITLSWNANGNPSWTSYQVNYWQGTSSTQTLTANTTTATIMGIAPATTYYLSVSAVNSDGNINPGSQVISTMTGIAGAAPVNAMVILTSTNSASFSWGANGNPLGTSYFAEISSNNFATITASSQTVNSTATFYNLGSNTSYYLQVQVANNSSAFDVAPDTWTLAVSPSSASPSSVGTNSITFNWGANGNSSYSQYRLNYTTAASFAGGDYITSATVNTFAIINGLLGNATYYGRVKVIGLNGVSTNYTSLPSTMTYTAAPALSTNTYFDVGASSIAFQWTSDNNSTWTVYNVQMSTDNFNTVNVASATTNLSLVFGTGGAGPPLNINTSYYFEVAAIGNLSSSAYVSLDSTATLAVAPTSLSITNVYASSMTLSWVGGANPAWTSYQVNYWRVTGSTQSVTVNTATAAITSLFTSATYYVSVAALNVDGVAAADSLIVSTALPGGFPVPGNPTITAVYLTSTTYSWTLNGAPGGTSYLAEVSTNDYDTVAQSSQTQNTFATFAGLNSNTTYYFQVQVANPPSDFSFAPVTSTLVALPLSGAPSAINANSIAENWGADNNAPTTLYLAQISTNSSFAPVFASSLTYNASAAFSNLYGDATYYAQVQAYGNDGSATSFVALSSTMTLPAVPALAADTFTSVGVSSVTVAWASGGNAAGTIYDAQISTDNFNSVNYTSATTNLYAVFGTGGAGQALNANTTYYFQAQAVGGANSSGYASLGSTFTLAAVPMGLGFEQVNFSSMTVSWGSGGNPLGTSYQVSYWQAAGSTQSLVVNATTAAVFSLSVDTMYYVSVAAINSDGVFSANSQVASTMTLNYMLPANPAVTAVYLTSAAYSWSENGNPVGTPYLAEVSTDNFLDIAASSQTENALAVFTSLNLNTTYYFQVQVSTPASAFVTAPTTSTLAAAPVSLGFEQVNLSSMSVSWNSNGNPAWTSYQVSYWQTTGSTQSLSVSATTATLASLTVDATYYVSIAAISNGGELSADSQIISAVTSNYSLPLNPAATAVYLTSAAYSWGANGNPAGTPYLAEISTNNFASVAASSQTENASATFTSMGSNTTYYFQVQVTNPVSAFVAGAATSTLAAAPLSGNPSAVGSGVLSENWGANGNSSTTLYLAQISTDNFADTFASSVTYGVSASFTGLSPDTTYYGQVAAYGNSGGETAFTPLTSTMTLIVAPTPLTTTFLNLGASSMTVEWGSGGNGAGTIYDAQISTDDFNSVNYTSATVNLYAAFGLGGAGPALRSNTSYYFQVRAVNGGGGSSYVSLGSTFTLAVPPAGLGFEQVDASSMVVSWGTGGNMAWTSYEVSYWQASGSTQSLMVSATTATISSLSGEATYYVSVAAINGSGLLSLDSQFISTVTAGYPSTSAVVTSTGADIVAQGSNGPEMLQIPAGEYNQTIQVTLQAPLSLPNVPSTGGNLAPTGIGLQVNLSPDIEPNGAVLLTMSYQNFNLGSVSPSNLYIARYDPVDNVWTPLPSTVNASNQSVTSVSTHLSTFQIMSGTPPTSVGQFQAWPNPLRPAIGESLMSFLAPANARIRIYTLAGELVNDITAASDGTASWGGTNRSGRPVASGVYFVFVQGAGQKKTFKVAIER